MKTSELPLPASLIQLLESQGYVELYPPQEDAVRAGVLDGKSMLLTTPTASGKTLVAVFAAGKTVLERGGKVVYLTPLRALANEKHEELSTLQALKKPQGENIRVLISTGDYDASGESLGQGDILVLTNEKFDSVLRHGVTWLDSVRLFVADEVHLVGDSDRGPTIETILTKILTYAPAAQVLALSATISNPKELSRWLGTGLVDVRWRPVRLLEGVYEYGQIRFSDGSLRKINPTGRGAPIDVAVDVLFDGGQSLVFAETRRRAVSLAVKAAEITPRFLSPPEQDRLRQTATDILGAGEETELSRTLSRAVENGAAFHHAGLHAQHRRIVEGAFRAGFIKILTATPTLAAGVNLPARRVVVSSLMRYDSEWGGQAPITVLDYKQMCGRAGRPKFDTVGETVLISSSAADAEQLLYQYIRGEPEPIRSKLSDEGAMRVHLLATIATLPGISEPEISELFGRTLFATQYRPVTVKSKLSRALEYLLTEDIVEKRGKRFIATPFGRRISMLYIDPATGVAFRRALKAARALGSHEAGLLHLVVSCLDFSPRFPTRSRDWEEALAFLQAHYDEFIVPVPDERRFDIYDEFMQDLRSLLVMTAWINEWHEDRILSAYGVEPGDLHRAVENADWLLYSLYEVARLVDRGDLLSEIYDLRQRVKQGVREELLPLVRLEGIGRVRARALYNAGYTTLDRLSAASVERLASVPKIGAVVAKKIKEQIS